MASDAGVLSDHPIAFDLMYNISLHSFAADRAFRRRFHYRYKGY